MTLTLSRTELNILLWALAASPSAPDEGNDVRQLEAKLRGLRDAESHDQVSVNVSGNSTRRS